jgi:hypothetical protein
MSATRPAAVNPVTDTTYNPYADKWAYTDTGAKNTGYLPKIRAADIVNGQFAGGDQYGQFSYNNMAGHRDNYQSHMNPDGTFTLGVKTDGKNRLDTTYVKQGDYYVPQTQKNQYWDTGSGGFLKNTLKDVAPIASLAAMAIPGMQPFALGLNALNAGVNKNYLGALSSALPLVGQLGNLGSTFSTVANGMNTANQGLGAVKSFQNGDVLGGLGGLAGAASGVSGMTGNKDLAGLMKQLSQGSGVANNLQRGNVLGALGGAAGMAGYGDVQRGLGLAGTVQKMMDGGNSQPNRSAAPTGPSPQQARQIYAQIQQKLQSMPGQPVPPQVQQMMKKLQQVMGGGNG